MVRQRLLRRSLCAGREEGTTSVADNSECGMRNAECGITFRVLLHESSRRLVESLRATDRRSAVARPKWDGEEQSNRRGAGPAVSGMATIRTPPYRTSPTIGRPSAAKLSAHLMPSPRRRLGLDKNDGSEVLGNPYRWFPPAHPTHAGTMRAERPVPAADSRSFRCLGRSGLQRAIGRHSRRAW